MSTPDSTFIYPCPPFRCLQLLSMPSNFKFKLMQFQLLYQTRAPCHWHPALYHLTFPIQPSPKQPCPIPLPKPSSSHHGKISTTTPWQPLILITLISVRITSATNQLNLSPTHCHHGLTQTQHHHCRAQSPAIKAIPELISDSQINHHKKPWLHHVPQLRPHARVTFQLQQLHKSHRDLEAGHSTSCAAPKSQSPTHHRRRPKPL
jgi:hypothetical protein